MAICIENPERLRRVRLDTGEGSRQGEFPRRSGPKKEGAGPKADSPFSSFPPEREPGDLVAGTRTVGDLHAPVLRLADTIGSLDQRTALAERLGGHHAVGDA